MSFVEVNRRLQCSNLPLYIIYLCTYTLSWEIIFQYISSKYIIIYSLGDILIQPPRPTQTAVAVDFSVAHDAGATIGGDALLGDASSKWQVSWGKAWRFLAEKWRILLVVGDIPIDSNWVWCFLGCQWEIAEKFGKWKETQEKPWLYTVHNLQRVQGCLWDFPINSEVVLGHPACAQTQQKKHQKLMGQTKNTDCQRMGSIYRWFPLWKPPGGSICRSIGDSPAAFMTGVPICFANLKELVIILPILQENRKPCMENLVTHWDPGTLLPNCFGNLFRNISASAWDVYPKSSMKKCSSDGHNGEQWWPSRFGLGIHRHPKRCFRFGSGFREGSADCLGTRCVNQIFGVPFWNILDDKDRMTPQLMGIYRGRKNGAFPWLPYLKSPAFGNLRGRCFGEIWDTDIHLYILMIPSGNFSHSYWKWPIYRCFTH